MNALAQFESVVELRARLNAVLTERDELRRECDQLRGELELRNAALDATDTYFMITDIKRRDDPIVYVNRALAVSHGYEPRELIGKAPELLVPREINPAKGEEVKQAVRSGAGIRATLRSRRKDGSEFWAGVTLTPIFNRAGHVTHFVSVGADISARLKEEEDKHRLQEQLYEEMQERERMAIELRLAQKLEAVGRLAAGIAHEINTPIQYLGDSVAFLQTAIAAMETLLERYREDVRTLADASGRGDVLEALERFEQSMDVKFLREEIPKSFERSSLGIDRVTGIVRAMKEFAHPDSAEQSGTDLNHAIQTTLTVAHNEYKYHAQVVTDFGVLPEVICNVGELNQVFLNLIVNAAHAIQESGKDSADGRITLSTSADSHIVCISIADNGCGIPAGNLERVFDPFFTTKEIGRGTGQGLAIARSIIVDKHSGTIDVQSTVGVGTRFTLRLPIRGRKASSPG